MPNLDHSIIYTYPMHNKTHIQMSNNLPLLHVIMSLSLIIISYQ